MNVLVYISEANGKSQELIKILNSLKGISTIDVHSSLKAFSERLRKPIDDTTASVLCVGSREELSDLLQIRPMLRDTKIILVLPDENRETLSAGHQLRPSFLTSLQSDLNEIPLVLRNIFQKFLQDKAPAYNPVNKENPLWNM